MFDLAWSELALIGVVALIAIGPKDLPVAIKAVTDMIKKARRMASEFQTHVDDMVKDANLNEVRDHINDLRTLDIKGKILSAVDGDQTLRKALNDDPFATTANTSAIVPGATASGEPGPGTAIPADTARTIDAMPAELRAAPAFIPPSAVPVPPPPSPAFIPPEAAKLRT